MTIKKKQLVSQLVLARIKIRNYLFIEKMGLFAIAVVMVMILAHQEISNKALWKTRIYL